MVYVDHVGAFWSISAGVSVCRASLPECSNLEAPEESGSNRVLQWQRAEKCPKRPKVEKGESVGENDLAM